MVTWDPIRELERFQHELDHLFTGPSGTVHQYPSVNVWTTENEAYLTAELPGMEASDLDISVLGQKVTLSGKRQPREMNEKERLHRPLSKACSKVFTTHSRNHQHSQAKL